MSRLILYAVFSPQEVNEIKAVGYVPIDTPLHQNPRRLIDFFKIKAEDNLSLAEIVCSHDDITSRDGEFHFPVREGIAVSNYLLPKDIPVFNRRRNNFTLD